MRRLIRVFWLLVIAAIAGGAIFLATWDIPSPTATVEVVLPDEQFPK